MGEESLECPFTWGIDENLARKFDESEEFFIEVEEQPVLALINSLSYTYFLAVQEKYRKSLQKFAESQKILEQLDPRAIEKDQTSRDVLVHITQATAYYVYKLNNMPSKALKTRNNLVDLKNFCSDIEIATINGCKSIVWTSFHEAGCQQAVPLAEAAVVNSPSCSLWHYILGKNLRHVRRNIDGLYQPSSREKKCLLKCYELSPIAFYGIHVAQMYKENREMEKSKKIYFDIYKSHPTSIGMNLRLAKGLTTFNDFDKAKKCLECAGKQNQKNSMYLHYKGFLYKKQRKWKKAADSLKEAAKNGNYRANFDYADAMMKLSKGNFDYLKHLQLMLGKYDNITLKQTILLHISMQFYYRKNDLVNTSMYLLKAIELNPFGKQLKDFRNTTINWNQCINIFNFVCDTLLPSYYRQENSEQTNDMQNVLKSLKDVSEKRR